MKQQPNKIEGDCPSGYSKFTINGSTKCLMHEAGKHLLGQAMSICSGKGGYLPLPLNDQENTGYFDAFMTFNLSSGSKHGEGVALDLTDVATEGTFVRISSGAAPSYTFWDTASGEPNNYMGSEHYVVMFTSPPFWAANAHATWNDFAADKLFDLVCETDSI